jgi:hypothetical protein
MAKRLEHVLARDRDALVKAASRVRWWEPALALVAIGVIYALVSTQLTVGSQYGVLAVSAAVVIAAALMRRYGRVRAGRRIALAGMAVITFALTVSAIFLIDALLTSRTQAIPLLRDAALLWVSNLLTFALWYWEVDGGGPSHRHTTHGQSTDFAFPQTILASEDDEPKWVPEFLDYVFLAFNTSTAFSPTDTMVLARRAKLMMMYQSILSLVTVAVIAARAINTIS